MGAAFGARSFAVTSINLKVLDISHYNEIVSFQEIYDFGVRGIIHKASQGVGYVDPQYAKNRRAALAAGLLWGAYHFADGSDPIAQALHFIDAADPDHDTLMALDFERNGGSTMKLESGRKFLQEIEREIGRKAVIYSGDLVKESLGEKKDAYFGEHRLWLAEYGPKAVVPPTWESAWLWQFSGDGVNDHGLKVPGIKGEIDMNSFAGTDDELAEQWP